MYTWEVEHKYSCYRREPKWVGIGFPGTISHSSSLPSLGSSFQLFDLLSVLHSFHFIMLLHSNFTIYFFLLHSLSFIFNPFFSAFLLSCKQLPARLFFRASFFMNLNVSVKPLTFVPLRVPWSHRINWEVALAFDQPLERLPYRLIEQDKLHELFLNFVTKWWTWWQIIKRNT